MEFKISIIIPVYNVERFLRKCLDSVLGQTYQNLEVICVNDGSSDASLAILREYEQRDNRMVVIDQQNSGVSIARNNALAKVTGNYYMFLDSDDWLDPETCEVILKNALETEADCVMYAYTKEFGNHSVVSHIFNNGNFVIRGKEVKDKFHRRLFGLIGEELAHPEEGDIIVSPCMQLFKASKFKHIQFYDIRQIGTFEDGLYQMDLYKDCECFSYIDQPFYHYLKTNEISITTKYKPQLIAQWQHLFDVIKSKIPVAADSTYLEGLDNRICMSMIGLGLNQTKSGKGLFVNAKILKNLLQTERYQKAFHQLDCHYFPIHWKLFFYLCKFRMTLILVMMLGLMDFLKKR